MFKGLRTVIYNVKDINAAKDWYSRAFGAKPYFDQPFYVGFNIGGYELGLDPNMKNVLSGNNAIAYWGVDDIESAVKHLVTIGGTIKTEIQDVGDGIKVATVADPFGNVIGVIKNPHFKVEEMS